MFSKIKKNLLSELIQYIFINIFSKFLKNYKLPFLSKINFVNFNFVSEIYNKNKKILLNKGDNFFKFLDNQIQNIDFELSFLDNIDKKYLISLIKKFENLSLNDYISFMSKDIRLKIIEKFKNIIYNLKLLYIIFNEIIINYYSVYLQVRIVRAPPFSLNF